MRTPAQLLSDPPCVCSSCFDYFPVSDVSMKIYLSNNVSFGESDFWNLMTAFVFVPQYYWMMFLMIWYFWWITMPYLLCIMVILRSLSLSPSSTVDSKRVSNSWFNISKQILCFVVIRMSSLYTTRIDL